MPYAVMHEVVFLIYIFITYPKKKKINKYLSPKKKNYAKFLLLFIYIKKMLQQYLGFGFINKNLSRKSTASKLLIWNNCKTREEWTLNFLQIMQKLEVKNDDTIVYNIRCKKKKRKRLERLSMPWRKLSKKGYVSKKLTPLYHLLL